MFKPYCKMACIKCVHFNPMMVYVLIFGHFASLMSVFANQNCHIKFGNMIFILESQVCKMTYQMCALHSDDGLQLVSIMLILEFFASLKCNFGRQNFQIKKWKKCFVALIPKGKKKTLRHFTEKNGK